MMQFTDHFRQGDMYVNLSLRYNEAECVIEGLIFAGC